MFEDASTLHLVVVLLRIGIGFSRRLKDGIINDGPEPNGLDVGPIGELPLNMDTSLEIPQSFQSTSLHLNPTSPSVLSLSLLRSGLFGLFWR